MHHELLLALSGCPGSVFITSKDTGLYEIIPDLPFIHPSEVAIINKIVRLGSYYQTLDEFITNQLKTICSLTMTPQPQATPPNKHGGLYLRALAFGIDNVLDAYRQCLVDIEKQCIADPCLPLSNVQCQLEEFQVLFASLDASVKSILSEKVHGCCILSFIHEKCLCGIPYVKESYERILSAVCQVFYKQLTVWMAHGLLKDQFDEFFIINGDSGDNEAKENVLSVYKISPTMKPSFISMRVAEQILFIGEAVRVFHNDNGSQSVTKISKTASSLLVDQFSFTRLLSELQENLFNLRVFESVCSRVRDSVAEHLWKLVVEEADLLSSLQLLKEFFLLGRGGLFLSFINTANSFMSLSHTATSEHDVNVAFRQALVKMGFESETLLHQFRFTLPVVNKQSKKVLAPKVDKGEKAWNLLGLSYKPQWPLHVFFTPIVLEKYNNLFKFLLSMKRAHTDLHKCWHLQMSRRQRCNNVWQLRLHMAFLLDNLQYYVQVDILETQFMQLLEKINSSHDFEYINLAHEQFLSTLQAQLFFKTPMVLQSIKAILELCHRYYAFVNSMGEVLTPHEYTTLERLTKEFHRQSSLLFRILSGVKSLHATPHLSQLLLRVDYNKYFSSKMSSSHP